MTADKSVVTDPKEDRPKQTSEEQRRQPVTCDALQSVITAAVRASGPQCQAFVGVLLEKAVPKSPGDVNWALKGIKYGKGDRTQCDAAISDIVTQLQREFVIWDEPK
jgi:hypothetical protein